MQAAILGAIELSGRRLSQCNGLGLQVRCCVTMRCRAVSGCRETGVTVEVLALRKGCRNDVVVSSLISIDSQWRNAGIRNSFQRDVMFAPFAICHECVPGSAVNDG